VRLFVQVVAMGQLAHHVFKTALGVVKLVGHSPAAGERPSDRRCSAQAF
jgi:hypothetical protein